MDDLHRELIKSGRKVYRRRRKFQGADWTPPSVSSVKQDGLWCRACRQHHGYMSMGMSYNKSSSGWELLWLCRKTGDVLDTTRLGESRGT